MDWFPRWWEKKEEAKELPPKQDTRKTIHQRMYEIATANYNPFSVGGSENAQRRRN